jgi:hypothetical protein
MTRSSITPSSSVSDDVPIFATIRTSAPRHFPCWYSKLKLAIQTMSPSIAPAFASSLGTCRRFELVVDVVERLGRGDVVQRHHALDLTADESELVLAEPLDASAPSACGRMITMPSCTGCCLAGLVHE